MTIEIPKKMVDEMIAHAESGLPNEACGVIAGNDGHAARVYPMRNAERSPVTYRFDEREQLEVFREIETNGWELLGFFHSHTHTEAYPSPTDRRRALWTDPVTGEVVPSYPETAYLIVSLKERERPELRAFRFRDGEPVEEELEIR